MAIFYEFKFIDSDDQGRFSYLRMLNIDQIVSIVKLNRHKVFGEVYKLITTEITSTTGYDDIFHHSNYHYLPPADFYKFVKFLRNNGSIVKYYDDDILYDPTSGA